MSNKDKTVKSSGDRKFKEIRRELNKKSLQKRNENVVHEYYVDSSRMISCEIGGEGDLKHQMHETIKKWGGEFGHGEHHDYNVVKLAEHYMKKGNYYSAVAVLRDILGTGHPSISAKVAFSRCHLFMGNWTHAMESADIVLCDDRRNIKAILVKAEAMFNLCQFEHSLVLFHRGLTLVPDMDEFRLGVQKCRKTIDDGVGNPGIFQLEGLDMLFKMLTVAAGTREMRLPGPGEEQDDKSCKMGLVNLTKFIGDPKKKKSDVIDKNLENKKSSTQTQPEINQSKILNTPKKRINSADKTRPRSATKKERINSADWLKQNPNRPKSASKVDRLLEDKNYLTLLSNGIGRRLDIRDDGTNKMVKATASQALDFLKARENFWDQLDLGQEHRQAHGSSLKVLQSYRWIM